MPKVSPLRIVVALVWVVLATVYVVRSAFVIAVALPMLAAFILPRISGRGRRDHQAYNSSTGECSEEHELSPLTRE
jgi:hypothetical protein